MHERSPALLNFSFTDPLWILIKITTFSIWKRPYRFKCQTSLIIHVTKLGSIHIKRLDLGHTTSRQLNQGHNMGFLRDELCTHYLHLEVPLC